MSSANRPRRPTIVLIVLFLAVLTIAALVAPPIAFHLLHPTYTGEAERLARALHVQPGDSVAEIGAGAGALIMTLQDHVQPGGRIYATELDPARLQQLREHEAEGLVVIEAQPSSVGLPEGCCMAVFMRNVYHHVGDTARFNRELWHGLRPRGRVAVIDFEPDTFRFMHSRPPGTSPHRTGHGVEATAVVGELQSAGFTIEHIDPDWGGWMFLVVAIK